ncbi:hypothetical protein GNP80_03675 [Aliivibrio fischeri]|uniref:hypothetical protein n=1 Tax=Aliivibrio fischeri TaxID=668 RepID=UPI0012D9C1F7|nr:hypothetical protein [Aliivibrio fischeri]MUK91550.1 hypothetical protein [Aliivibrio fischeri]
MKLRECDCGQKPDFDEDGIGHEIIVCPDCYATSGLIYLVGGGHDAESVWNNKLIECGYSEQNNQTDK